MGFHKGWLDVIQQRGLIEPVAPSLSISEKEFQAEVIRLLKQCGWSYFHCRDARGSNEGFPDLCCWRERLIFLELKTETGDVSNDQHRVIAELKAAGQEVYIIRPRDWSILRAILK